MGGTTGLFVGLHNKWLWKGEDPGSSIDDPYRTIRKNFIQGAPLRYSLAPMLNYTGTRFAFMGEYGFFDNRYVNVRIMFMM